MRKGTILLETFVKIWRTMIKWENPENKQNNRKKYIVSIDMTKNNGKYTKCSISQFPIPKIPKHYIKGSTVIKVWCPKVSKEF